MDLNRGQMFCWWFLLLQLAECVLLPPPSSVSFSSFNMEHFIHFLPGPDTPADSRFSVEVTRLGKKTRWRPVSNCSELTVGQTCDITAVITDPIETHRCRVRTSTPHQTSQWTLSERFLPLMDTVIGPPELSLAGCGSCLILRVTVPTSVHPQRRRHLQGLYRQLELEVTRVSDGAQFTLTLPYKEETVVSYLQRGTEYCVRVKVVSLLNPHSVAGRPECTFTSEPVNTASGVVILGLLAGFCGLAVLLTILLLYGAKLSVRSLQQQQALKKGQLKSTNS